MELYKQNLYNKGFNIVLDWLKEKSDYYFADFEEELNEHLRIYDKDYFVAILDKSHLLSDLSLQNCLKESPFPLGGG